jgi:spermidine synthase
MSNKYGGQLIHSSRDNYGPIEVIDFKQTLRSLHFGNATQQTGMFLYNPVTLIHKYTQAMLVSLCWQKPKNILILGLGAGAMPKYLLHFLEDCYIDIVELRPKVAQIAEEYFSLPLKHKRLNIIYSPAEEFLEATTNNNKYDLIIVDLFLTDKKKDITVDIASQVTKLKSLLTNDGCISLNIIGTEYLNYSALNLFQDEFNSGLNSIAVEESNVILLATNKQIPQEKQINFTALEKKYGLPFRQYFNKISPL